MLVVGIIVSIGLMGTIIYFAVSPKSSRLLRLSAIVALGLICLSLIVCGFFIIKGPAEDPDIILLPIFQDSAPETKNPLHIWDLVIMAVILISLSLIIAKALRDQKKVQQHTQQPKDNPVISKNDEEMDTSFGSDEDSFEFEDLDLK